MGKTDKYTCELYQLIFSDFLFADGKTVPDAVQCIEKCTIEDAIKQTGEYGRRSFSDNRTNALTSLCDFVFRPREIPFDPFIRMWF